MSARYVAVVVPFHNAEATLEACLETVAGQRDADATCIMVDDHSTDGSPEIARTYAKRHRWVLLESPERGAAAARNTGLAALQSLYVTFLDADDVLTDTACADMASVAERTSADLVCGMHGIVSWQGIVEPLRYMQPLLREKTGANLRAMDWTAIGMPTACGKLFASEFLSEHQLRFPALHSHEDVVFSAEAWLRAGIVSAWPRIVYVRRPQQNAGGLTGTYDVQRVEDRIAAADALVPLIESLGSRAVLDDNDATCITSVLEIASRLPDACDRQAAIAALLEFARRRALTPQQIERWSGLPGGDLAALDPTDLGEANYLYWRARAGLKKEIAGREGGGG